MGRDCAVLALSVGCRFQAEIRTQAITTITWGKGVEADVVLDKVDFGNPIQKRIVDVEPGQLAGLDLAPVAIDVPVDVVLRCRWIWICVVVMIGMQADGDWAENSKH